MPVVAADSEDGRSRIRTWDLFLISVRRAENVRTSSDTIDTK
jgi:hypothetical protein